MFVDEDDEPAERCSLVAFTDKLINGVLHIGACIASPRKAQDDKDGRNTTLKLIEFVDSESLTNLESLLLREHPRSCFFVPDKNAQKAKRLTEILTTMEITPMAMERSAFRPDGLEQDLRVLLDEEALSRYKTELGLTLAIQSLSCLVKMEIMPKQNVEGSCELTQTHLDSFLRLDQAAVEALHLFPTVESTNKESSLLGLLDRTMTDKIGKRLLTAWLRQPLTNMTALQTRQEMVRSLVDDGTKLDNIRAGLKSVPDLEKLVRKLQSKRADLVDLYRLYVFSQALPVIHKAVITEDSSDTETNPTLAQMATKLQGLFAADRLGRYNALVENVLDLSRAPREFRVKTCHDKTGQLESLSTAIAEIEERVAAIQEELQDGDLAGLNARFEQDSKMLGTYGFHFRVNKSHDNVLKKLKNKSYKYLAVVNACIRWTTQELTDLHERYSELNAKYNTAQRKLVQDAVEVARTFIPLVEQSSACLAELDCICSLAFVAQCSPWAYCLPELQPMNSQVLELQSARHPCLELQEDVEFIPNNFKLEKGKSNFQVITGPNMGGKSTYIRQLGIIAVMAQIGSYVPCEQAKLPILDAVLCRVGANDALHSGVSTFMCEMVEASAILGTATENSLVIIDELGRGTSTYDGFGLAWGISQHIATKIKSFCLFATHFHELTSLALEVECVVNKHVSAVVTEETVAMLYNVVDGPSTESYGINIASLSGFPDDVIDIAKAKAKELEGQEVKDQNKAGSISSIVSAFAKMDEAKLCNMEALEQQLLPLMQM